jgi:hypothetical protein
MLRHWRLTASAVRQDIIADRLAEPVEDTDRLLWPAQALLVLQPLRSSPRQTAGALGFTHVRSAPDNGRTERTIQQFRAKALVYRRLYAEVTARRQAGVVARQTGPADIRPHFVDRAGCRVPHLALEGRATVAIASHMPAIAGDEGIRDQSESRIILERKPRPFRRERTASSACLAKGGAVILSFADIDIHCRTCARRFQCRSNGRILTAE